MTIEIPLFLRHSSVDADGWEVLLHQQLSQSYTSLDRLDKDDDLEGDGGVME